MNGRQTDYNEASFDELNAFSKNLLLDFVEKFNTDIEDTEMQKKKTQQKLSIIGNNYTVDREPIKLQIKALFEKSDYKFFKKYFPSLELNYFREMPISHLLVVLSTFFDYSHLLKISNFLILKKELKFQPQSIAVLNNNDIFDMVDLTLPSATKFYVNFLERRKWHDSLKLSDRDIQVFKEMLSLLRSEFKRIKI